VISHGVQHSFFIIVSTPGLASTAFELSAQALAGAGTSHGDL